MKVPTPKQQKRIRIIITKIAIKLFLVASSNVIYRPSSVIVIVFVFSGSVTTTIGVASMIAAAAGLYVGSSTCTTPSDEALRTGAPKASLPSVTRVFREVVRALKS